MRTSGSFGVTSHGAELESDVHPALRNYSFWRSIASLIVLCFMFLFIAVKGWHQLSASVLGWMAFSVLWAALLFREAWITHARLRMVLAVAQVEPVDKKLPLDKVLNLTTEASKKMLFFSSFSLLALLTAVIYILSAR